MCKRPSLSEDNCTTCIAVNFVNKNYKVLSNALFILFRGKQLFFQ
jgi:hypothetical protein